MFGNETMKLGFGCMRLPKKGEQIDLKEFSAMVDAYLEAGGRYFDTAHVYHKGASELALRDGLTSRYPRESYLLTNKLSTFCYQTEEELEPYFACQLEACGVDYFDNYLFHAVNPQYLEQFQRTNAFEHVRHWQEEGKIRHVGMSFHSTPDFLREMLDNYPQIEMVQLQFNYADTDNPDVQAIACYNVCCEYQKPVVVMEPIKGGTLADLPQEGKALLQRAAQQSESTFALRYCASFPQVQMILSGMSSLVQMQENLQVMREPKSFTEAEYALADQLRTIVRQSETIGCTGCRYCVDGCPQGIPIPDLFAAYNARLLLQPYSVTGEAAQTCLQCGACEEACPQSLKIPKLLKEVAYSLK